MMIQKKNKTQVMVILKFIKWVFIAFIAVALCFGFVAGIIAVRAWYTATGEMPKIEEQYRQDTATKRQEETIKYKAKKKKRARQKANSGE